MCHSPKNPSFDSVLLDEIRRSVHTAYPADQSVQLPDDESPPVFLTPTGCTSATERIDIAEPQVTYAHASGCCFSPEPEVVIISEASIALLDGLASERLKNINRLLDSELVYDGRPTLESERIRLEQCLKSTIVAKGMYIKRCNDEFRNALNDQVLPNPTGTPDGYRASEFGYALLDVNGPREKKRWTYDDKGWPKPVPTTFTYKDLMGQRETLGKHNDGSEEVFVKKCWWRIRSGKRSEETLDKLQMKSRG